MKKKREIDKNFERTYDTQIKTFQNLMRFKIRDILLVSSLYDLYLLEEDGRLYELLQHEYRGLNLSHTPELTRVSSTKKAVDLAQKEGRFNLIITTMHVEGMHALAFARLVKESGLDIPIVLLGYDNREFSDLITHQDTSVFDGIFIWQGDYRILLAIIKSIEDRRNVAHDIETIGVQVIIAVEDNVQYYSSFLPLIYIEVMKQSQQLISEGVSLSHKYIRMRARPKILLANTYEQAWDYYTQYQNYVLGVISDIDLPRLGKSDPQAGIRFAKSVKAQHPDIPILLQSTEAENEKKARDIDVSFTLKGSPTLLQELQYFISRNFGFGDFVFRNPGGETAEISPATDLISLEQKIRLLPEESLVYHSKRNHFSTWLKARTEFWLANKIRPTKVTDFSTVERMRDHLVSSLRHYRKSRQRGVVSDFIKEAYDHTNDLARIGEGSLGGKARGLNFLNTLINSMNVYDKFKGVRVYVPPGVILGAKVFDDFLDTNHLRAFALKSQSDKEITERFLNARYFPDYAYNELRMFLEMTQTPLAVRSSSLLEDSQYHPFAGVYETYMIPNNQGGPSVRLNYLVNAIKRVYASTFYQQTKEYIKMTTYRLEEEKMAVIVQKMVGSRHDNRFYPDFAGVAKSHNFYPISPQNAEDGIIAVALGLGKTVVEGEDSIKFSPKMPQHFPQFSSAKDTLRNSQNSFWALSLDNPSGTSPDFTSSIESVKRYELDVAEKDGTLFNIGSVYSPENESVYPGLSRRGIRLVTFAPLLKYKLFPLPEALDYLLQLGCWGMGTAVEIEFAVQMSRRKGKPHRFGVLQMRPLVINKELEELNVENYKPKQLICQSQNVLGNGVIDGIYDIVAVDIKNFDRSKSQEVARELTQLNAKLVSEKRPYLLFACGRLGTVDPWLGIPLKWEQISGAHAIVETGLLDMIVEPSQGSHFFQNITAFMVGYFTVYSTDSSNFINWDWLYQQPATEEMSHIRLIHFDSPVLVKMNGKKGKGVIVKPEEDYS